MTPYSAVMAILADESGSEQATQLANALGYDFADIVIGSPLEATAVLSQRSSGPRYLLIDIGERSHDVLPEIDTMAEHCEPDTKVVIVGSTNDVNFYRELRMRGVIEYFTRPARTADLKNALLQDFRGTSSAAKVKNSTVLTFMSAASGDGSSTVAVNVAYALARKYNKRTVLIDMDYQFGMIARNLDLANQFGIREIFDHPERGIDATLVERMLVDYVPNLSIIAAPNELRFLPFIKPEVIRDLIRTLQGQFEFVIIDLPHIWSTWVAAALSNANHNFMVAQLWLRSVTHSARILSSWRDIGISDEHMSIIINRSGAKYKEAISNKDYERIAGKKIEFFLTNDIRSIVMAENLGKTILETGNSILGNQLTEIAEAVLKKYHGFVPADTATATVAETKPKSGIGSLFKR
jgi:pilus assembly protein CpaE